MKTPAALFLLLPVVLAGLPVESPATSPQGDPPSTAPVFTEVPGVQEFTSRLIVRPVQRVTLVEEGWPVEGAFARREAARRELRDYDLVRYVPETDEYILRVPIGLTEAQVAERLMQTGNFEYATPDWWLYPAISPAAQQTGQARAPGALHTPPLATSNCPDDPMFPVQWHHAANRVASCEGWALETGNPTVGIGVCDTGLRTTHEDLQLHRLEAYNAVDQLWESEGGQVGPVYYHGTRTTGAAAANGDNGLGVVGIGWNLSHRMLRVSNQTDGGAYLSDIQHGARTSIESGDRVANVSYHGASSASNPTTATYVKSIGGLLLWSAGNTSSNYSHVDRDADDLIVVGATDQSDALATFSSYGTFIDLVAPGVGITTTDSGFDADYATADGTSYSCPLTSGLCAMIWSMRPTLSPNDVERILKAGAEDIGAPGVDDFFGHGRINLVQSLLYSGSDVPTADFAGVPVSGRSPLTVEFTDLSSGVPTAWLWDFGDGGTSGAQNPSYVYAVPGSYTVSLAVTNALGSDVRVRSDYVLVDVIPPIAEFSGTPTSGVSPLVVDFADESAGGLPTTWLWAFGDGSTSVLPNPTHTYTGPGYYTVSLNVSNAYGTDSQSNTSYIVVDYVPPIAGFSGQPTTGASPYVVDFTDESTGGVATTWQWIFGDGWTSTAQHPAHTYTTPGTYSVRLTVGNAYGSDLLWRTDYIEVGAGPPLVADFEGTPLTGSAPLQVAFTDLSIGHITEWDWNFGDGTTSALQHPTHVYSSPGEYDVALQVTNADGSDSQLEKQKYVVVQ